MDWLRERWVQAGIRTQANCPLCKHSTFGIGGAARLAVFPATREQTVQVLDDCRRIGRLPLVIGKGSNIVFDDRGYDGVVVFTTAFQEVSVSREQVNVSAGFPLIALAVRACDMGLSGLEFACGIPATVGGAVFMNAGAYGSSLSQVCICSEYYDARSGEIAVLAGEAQRFGVRTSAYEQNPQLTILGAILQLVPGDREEIRKRMAEYRARRNATQPCTLPSAGSVFKHPTGHFAGKLIEDCGLKGTAVGGAQVSELHAGFIINRGGATASDVRALVARIRETVLCTYGIELECEIRFLPHTDRV